YLHSATMVKAGVYLLLRMNPVLGDTVQWQTILPAFGGLTLLTGAILALRQTDMKQMLAYTTVGTLGMLVMLIGVGSEAAIAAAILVLVAHAFYKGALFLIAGTIDRETGTYDITQVSGLFARMPVSGIAAILAAISMAGIPVSLGYFAKEEVYSLLADPGWREVPVVIVALVGNALMLVVGLAIAMKVFFGAQTQTPKAPHEGPLSMISGSLILGVASFGAGFVIHDFGRLFVVPSVTAVRDLLAGNHLETWHFAPLLLALSVVTWALGALAFWFLDDIRTQLRRLAGIWSWGPDHGFDQAMFGLIRSAGWITRMLHHGRLEIYFVLIFVALALVTLGPLLAQGLPPMPGIPYLTFYEWGIMVIALMGLFAVVVGRTRLVAIVSLGVQGFAVAVIFILFGAPDLGFTQFMVETLTVVILTLVMTRLRLEHRDTRIFEDVVRDGALAIIAGAGVTVLLFAVLRNPLDTRLSEFFTETSVALAHGHNIVNVILVDYRALDTLGEITVVMTAGIAILALIRLRAGGQRTGAGLAKRAPAPKKRAGRAIRTPAPGSAGA
ncbi:MAG: hydrogen gas-evolving membrane-bound hydrogenase subunit E, partial [Cucumibacter sp.]